MKNPAELEFKIPRSKDGIEAIDKESVEVLKKGYEEAFLYETPEFFIEKGGAGAVYELPGGFCIKFFFERHDSPYSEHMDLGNTPQIEASLLERMSETSFAGNVRVPKYLGTIEKAHNLKSTAMVMERLNADNLQHIFNSKLLPEKFNADTFTKELEAFIEHMHSEDRIVHNDLFPRNIMVDRETGSPRVIDFGRSIDTTYFTDETARLKAEEEDWNRFDEVCEEIYALQK